VGMAAYIVGFDTSNDGVRLYTIGSPTTLVTSLMTRGIAIPGANFATETPNLLLMLAGNLGQTAGVTMFTGITPADQIGLFMLGVTPDTIGGSHSLAVYGSTTPTFVAAADMYVVGDGTKTGAVNLFLPGPSSIITARNMNLFTGGRYLSAEALAQLYVKGLGTSDCADLWDDWATLWEEAIAFWDCEANGDLLDKGAGTVSLFLAGAPVGSNAHGMNLYLQRPEYGLTPLFLLGPPGTAVPGADAGGGR
jgi:hypothetical protein